MGRARPGPCTFWVLWACWPEGTAVPASTTLPTLLLLLLLLWRGVFVVLMMLQEANLLPSRLVCRLR